jgi:hypothetical protein
MLLETRKARARCQVSVPSRKSLETNWPKTNRERKKKEIFLLFGLCSMRARRSSWFPAKVGRETRADYSFTEKAKTRSRALGIGDNQSS